MIKRIKTQNARPTDPRSRRSSNVETRESSALHDRSPTFNAERRYDDKDFLSRSD